MTSYKIEGFVLKGFESVQIQFEKNFNDGLEKCAQLCVYVGEEKVVDLWGSMSECKNFDGDSITNVFSSTKSLSAICMATLVDQKLLHYDDKIIKHWPQYGNGDKEKEAITIADVLRHEGGMATFSKTLKMVDLLPENIKKNSIGRVIETEPLHFPPANANTKAEYHALTRGYILNEIFRRVDPQGRTIGEGLKDTISTPLNADCYIGLDYEQVGNPYPLSYLSLGEVLRSSFVPKMFGRKGEVNAIDIMKFLMFLPKSDSVPPIELMTKNIISMIKQFEISVVRMGELPSANGQCSARGLAKIGAMIANGGTFDGKVILSEETCEQFHSNSEEVKVMHPFGINMNFSQGGVNHFKVHEVYPNERTKISAEYRKGYIGWMGLGGSILQWRLDHKISIAYVPTFLAWEDFMNNRAGLLQKIVSDCVENMNR